MLASTRTVTSSTVNGGHERVVDALGDRLGAVDVDVEEEHGELVAAEAGEYVVDADEAAGDALGDVTQQVVAGVVPQAVVDLLEPVEVEQQQCALDVRGGRQATLDLLVEGPAVAQPGELVGEGELVAVRESGDLAEAHDEPAHGRDHGAGCEGDGDRVQRPALLRCRRRAGRPRRSSRRSGCPAASRQGARHRSDASAQPGAQAIRIVASTQTASSRPPGW